jgi:hypothetical protein
LRATAEASQLHAALRAKANNRPATTDCPPEPVGVLRDDPSEEEIKWLILVAVAYTRSTSPNGEPRSVNTQTRR